VVVELHRLLVGAGIRPPYVLGGWSAGLFFNRLFTKRYPAEVVGLVGVDGTPFALPGSTLPEDPPALPAEPDVYYVAAAAAELAAASDLGSRPVVLLTHGGEAMPPDAEAEWMQGQKQTALLTTSSILVRAEGAGHAIQEEAPSLTAEAFRQVIAAVRSRAPLPACAATPLPRLGGTCIDPRSP
jgi:pimeloyl-ACP methyl ester carboxylesterase